MMNIRFIFHMHVMKTKDIIIKNIGSIETEVMLLTPVFTAQGGPGCIAVQAIKKHDILK